LLLDKWKGSDDLISVMRFLFETSFAIFVLLSISPLYFSTEENFLMHSCAKSMSFVTTISFSDNKSKIYSSASLNP